MPLADAWPTGTDVRNSFQKYGHAKRVPAEAIPVPARIATDVYVYLVGQDRVSNLTYMLDCGPDGVAIIDPPTHPNLNRRQRGEVRAQPKRHPLGAEHALSSRSCDGGQEVPRPGR